MPTDYKKLLEQEVRELESLLEQREAFKRELEGINSAVSRLREGVIGLAALAGVDLKAQKPELFAAPVKADLGLTDAIRKTLKENEEEFVSPTEIRDYLHLDLKFPIHLHKNPLASIHSVLKRLIDSGQAVAAEDKKTKRTLYAWADGYAATKLRLQEAEEAEAAEEE